MPTLIVMVAVVLAALSLPAQANDPTILACKRFLTSEFPEDLGQAMALGECLGTINTLSAVTDFLRPDRKPCVPPSVTIEQVMRVIIAYIERHPQRTEHFSVLGIDALREAWPCKK